LNSNITTKQNATEKKLVLAPGAADASEGTVCVEEVAVPCCQADTGENCVAGKPDIEYEYFVDEQPGEGFWAVTPGCADISEGRVWVTVLRKSMQA
jgi:hypothetical protein